MSRHKKYKKIKFAVLTCGIVFLIALSFIKIKKSGSGIGEVFMKPALASTFTDNVTSFANGNPNGGTLHLAAGTYVVDSNFAIPSNVTLRFDAGAIISIASGTTLVLEGAIDDNSHKIFDDANSDPGKGVKFKYGSVASVRPEWWGARADDNPASASSNVNALEKAMHSFWKYDSRWLTDSRYETMPKILLSIGKYYIDRTFVFQSKLILEGQGDIHDYNNVSVLRLKDNSNCAMLRDYDAGTNNEYGGSISNIFFHGGSQFEKVNGIDINHRTHAFLIKNNSFTNFNNFAINILGDGAGQNMIEKNIITNSFNGMRLYSFDGWADGNDVSFYGDIGIDLKNFAIVFQKNHVNGGASGKTCLLNPPFGSKMIDNTIENCDNGISGNIGATFSNNTIKNNRQHGVFISNGTGATMVDAILSGNTITGNGGYGIYLGQCFSSTIRNNNLTGNTTGAIYVDPAVRGYNGSPGYMNEIGIIEDNVGVDTGSSFQVLDSNKYAPSVLKAKRWRTANTSPTTISDFSQAPMSKEFFMDVADADTTLKLSQSYSDEKIQDGDFSTEGVGIWNKGTSWSYNSSGHSMAHIAGDYITGTKFLEQNVGTVAKGELYELNFMVKNRTAGYITPLLGYFGGLTGGADMLADTNGLHTIVMRVDSAGTLKFIPSKDFVGEITNISLKKINTALRGFGGVDKKFNSGDKVHCAKGPDTYWYCEDANLAYNELSSVDLNSDSLVNATDFGILKSDFLKLTANLLNPRSDIDADGQCTVKDVGILMSEWR